MSNSSKTKGRVFAFINAENLEDTKSCESRRQVSRHVGKYYRNRSKPSQKKVHDDEASQASENERSNDKSISDDFRILSSKAIASDAIEAHDQKMGTTIAFRRADRRRQVQATPGQSMAHDMKSMQQVLRLTRIGRCAVVQRENNVPQHSKPITKSLCDNVEEDSSSDEEMFFRRKWECGPIHLLSQNRADPFATYPVDESRDQISLIVDHAVQHFWSRLSPDRRSMNGKPVNAIYLSHMKSSPIAYYTYVLVISTNLDYLWETNPLQNSFRIMRAKHIHAATKLVRKAVESMPPEPRKEDIGDELIGSVLGLSSSHVINVVNRKHRPESRFKSPLAAAQCIDMWSVQPFIESHRLAVVQLVNLRGGLNALDSKYLASVVQLNDLVDASRKTRQPIWPWQSMVVDLPPLRWPFVTTKLSTLSNTLTSGFVKLTDDSPWPRELEQAISAVAEVTAILGLHEHNANYFVAEVVELRNRAQHLVLDLPCTSPLAVFDSEEEDESQTEGPLEANNRSRLLHEVMRISLLIYNNLVVFPMSLASQLETRLAKQLKGMLHSYLQPDEFNNITYINLLAWSIMLGGISTEDAEDREWFQYQYCNIIKQNSCLKRWRCTEELLSSFIWLDFILNEEAIKFWSACTRSEHF